MKKHRKPRSDWYRKLWTIPGLASDIEDLLRHHEPDCISRLAAQYWLERAGLNEPAFLVLWDQGEFRGC